MLIKNFNEILNNKNIKRYSRYTDKGAVFAERFNRTIRYLLQKPVFEKGHANWNSELPSVIKQYSNTIHSSIKMTPIQASEKSNEKLVSSNLQDGRTKQQPKFKFGQLVVQLTIKKCSQKEIVQITAINYIQSQKSYMIQYLVIVSTIYPRDIMKIYCYLLNYLLNKIIKL